MIPLPAVGPTLARDIQRWACDGLWDVLVDAFDGSSCEIPTTARDRLVWLDEFSNRWDARQGTLERDEAGELPLTTAQADLVLDAAQRLGMTAAAPPTLVDYDHVLALGGLIRACFIRPAHAASLLAQGTVRSPSFVALGGHRPFSDEERALATAAHLPELDSEFSALDAGAREAFGLDAPTSSRGHADATPGGSWTVHEYAAQAPHVLVAAAPSTDPTRRRANTSDAYRWMAEDLLSLRPGQRILAVTTSLYVPAQHAVAVATLGLPYGVIVETVGTDPDAESRVWAQSFSPTRHLMEFRSAIRSMLTLSDAAASRPDPR